MNFQALETLVTLNREFMEKVYNSGKIINVTLLNVKFNFSYDNILNEKLDKFVPEGNIRRITPDNNSEIKIKKSNRGKKSNKKVVKKIKRFTSNLKFITYDEIYDKEFSVIVFRKDHGNIPGLKCDDPDLIMRLINNVFNLINRQYPDKNFKYNLYKINLCNLRSDIFYNKHYILNTYILRDLLYIIYNKDLPTHDFIIKKKTIDNIIILNKHDKYSLLKDCFIDCIIKEYNVYAVIYYVIDDHRIVVKIYSNGKLGIYGSKNILVNYNIMYEIKHIVYRYCAILVSQI